MRLGCIELEQMHRRMEAEKEEAVAMQKKKEQELERNSQLLAAKIEKEMEEKEMLQQEQLVAATEMLVIAPNCF